jgi:hypothetical protein
MLEEILNSAISRSGVIRVRSALNPFLWALVWSVLFAFLAYLFRDDTATRFLCIGLSALPMFVALAVGVGFAISDPDRLQSEQFVLRQQALKTLYRRGATPEKLNVVKDIATMERLTKSRPEGEDDE